MGIYFIPFDLVFTKYSVMCCGYELVLANYNPIIIHHHQMSQLLTDW